MIYPYFTNSRSLTVKNNTIWFFPLHDMFFFSLEKESTVSLFLFVSSYLYFLNLVFTIMTAKTMALYNGILKFTDFIHYMTHI